MSREPASPPRRFVGIELSGAKNEKTAVAAIDFYPRERKIFLLDIYDRISGYDEKSTDQALLDTLAEIATPATKIAVNVALTLPPCIECTRKSCPLPQKCTVPAVRWMRAATRKAERAPKPAPRALDFTPYTQRPLELWVRYQVLPELPTRLRFEIDETLGGNRAPLSARMHFLKRHLAQFDLIEAWPKLTLAALAEKLGVPLRFLDSYRKLDTGVHAREVILEALCETSSLFVYERDFKKLTQSLAAFDALLCAYTALLADTGQTMRPPVGFPEDFGWLHVPESP